METIILITKTVMCCFAIALIIFGILHKKMNTLYIISYTDQYFPYEKKYIQTYFYDSMWSYTTDRSQAIRLTKNEAKNLVSENEKHILGIKIEKYEV